MDPSTPVYILSGICLAIGANCFINPGGEYARYGLPLENAAANVANKKSATTGIVSPLMYAKGTRELCFGLNFALLQYQSLYTSVTTTLAVYSIAAIVDGVVIWFRGDKGKALGHTAFGVGFAAWAAWRNGNF